MFKVIFSSAVFFFSSISASASTLECRVQVTSKTMEEPYEFDKERTTCSRDEAGLLNVTASGYYYGSGTRLGSPVVYYEGASNKSFADLTIIVLTKRDKTDEWVTEIATSIEGEELKKGFQEMLLIPCSKVQKSGLTYVVGMRDRERFRDKDDLIPVEVSEVTITR